MDTIKKDFASKLLEIKAIKLQPQNPFTWASGWKSPFYCDNRKTLSFTDVRSYVKLELAHAILAHFPQATAVAGVATGAIAQGAMVADELNMPFCYVRSKAKDHGMVFLLDELSKTGNPRINLTHEQIAKYMGSAREVVSRMLKYFAKEGMIEMSRGGIRILDKEKLRELTV